MLDCHSIKRRSSGREPFLITFLRGLKSTKITSFTISNCEAVNVFSADQIVGYMPRTLELLDISLISWRDFETSGYRVPIFHIVFLLPALKYLTLRNFITEFQEEHRLLHALETLNTLKSVRIGNCKMGPRLKDSIMKQADLNYIPIRYRGDFIFKGLGSVGLKPINDVDTRGCCSIA